MKEIVKNKYYELGYDEDDNTIHWTMKGWWPNLAAVPNFKSDWEKVEEIIKPGFGIFADLSEMKVMQPDIKEANDNQQAKLMEKGCTKVACIIIDKVAILSLNDALKGNDMQQIVKYFDNAADAWNWYKEGR